jgi:hypothetical protein
VPCKKVYRERGGFTIGPIRIDPLYGDPRFESAGREDCSGARIWKDSNSIMNLGNFLAELKRRNVLQGSDQVHGDCRVERFPTHDTLTFGIISGP